MLFRWVDDQLLDPDGRVIASVTAEVLKIGKDRLLIESSQGTIVGFRARGTSTSGAVYTMGKRGLTVHTLEANCDGRLYTLQRTSPWRRTRKLLDAEGSMLARIQARVSGELDIELFDAALHPVDAAFITYACALVDTPTRLMI
ncbi:hypothetical protein [Corynebacterium pseudopelargi]|uniref:Scramblase n=1 Tax=Corynebacterium pseudopelargi TaxID=2080757 RepID=A0A3G6IT23_9CORY|nr:hypothetical protein [Corynebacterium pseudopelargi]AZA08811.1 hypothetical protein CPPEL_03400 [Corynebacterium pseudopelargi]